MTTNVTASQPIHCRRSATASAAIPSSTVMAGTCARLAADNRGTRSASPIVAALQRFGISDADLFGDGPQADAEAVLTELVDSRVTD
jgi:hypothetical protein